MRDEPDPAGLPATPDTVSSEESPPSPRRRFLLTSIATLPAAAVLGACESKTPATPSAGSSAPAAASAAVEAFQPKFFNETEWAFIRAAVDILIPKDAEGPGALELGVANFIDNQMEGAWGHAATWYMQGPFKADASSLFGYQKPMPPRELYRASIAAIDAYCKQEFSGKRFVEIERAQQEQLLLDLDAGKIPLRDVSAQEFMGFLVQNTKEGYLSDPIHGGNRNRAAWDMIGFPGARADYLDWVSQPGKKYPFAAVNIAGKQT
ncbi:MAG: gluconate 2-dehydrogenase subunit 3 family protein [Rhodocyclaceae bacterium]